MQDVNNDMDDLFRKAAEQYPLKTDGADWQKILAGLQNAAVPAAEEKEKRKRRALWLFLLLPIGLVWGIYHKNFESSAKQIVNTKQAVKDSLYNDNIQASGLSANGSSFKTITENGEKSSAASGEIKSARNNSKATGNTALPRNDNEADAYTKGISDRSLSHSFITGNNAEYPNQKQAIVGMSSEEENHKKNELTLQPSGLSNRIHNTEAEDVVKEKITGTTVQEKTDTLSANEVKRDSTAAGSAKKSKPVKAKPRIQTGFYAGLLTSFDVSTVKLQRINKTGHGFELLAGYRFSKRFSVESGVNWTDKKYYSIGKYFDKTNTGISPQSKIIYTNGSCAMLEIPATLKYDFAQKKKSNWFATAGLSSYIMKDEKYSYYANHSGNYYSATKKYSHSGSNLFSVASLSLGYQLQLNKHLSLRAEPYIKMPLGGIGIAKMPITSTGITAGFTRSF